VVVEQFRPGVMARLGAAYDDLAMMNPKLVYCSFSGYGQTGPYRDLPGHDINFQALAGILSVTAGQDDKRPAIPGVPIADMASAFNAALAILAALRTRDRIGRGEWIDVSILDTAVTLMVLGLARFLATGDEPVPGETLLTGVFPFYSLYEAKDGRWLSVAAVEPKFWIRMCELVGAPELSERQFADGAERVAAAQTLAARFRERTSEDWGALFAKEQLPITLVKRVSEVVRDPHVMARELLPLIDVPDVGKLQVIAHPAKHAETKVRDPARVPGKGGNTVEILRSLGYTPRQIQAMAKKEVIGT
jgi:crotonobetainyl-CoA:carnitine CoA-transferase CaiB-like acyl-CoA transferase